MPSTQTKIELLKQIEEVLDELRVGLAMHGGNVECVDVNLESGQVFLRLQGACVGCSLSEVTLKSGIEEALCQMVPGVTEVVSVP